LIKIAKQFLIAIYHVITKVMLSLIDRYLI